MKKMFALFYLILFSTIGITQSTVTFRIHGLNKGEGLVRIALYDSETNYQKELSDLKFTYSKEGVLYGLLELELEVKPGEYAVAFLDDTNKDTKMNYNLIGIPKEGYAFSGIRDYGFSKPSYEDAKIEIKEEEGQVFKIYFNYF